MPTTHPEHFSVPSDANYASGTFITTLSRTSVCFDRRYNPSDYARIVNFASLSGVMIFYGLLNVL